MEQKDIIEVLQKWQYDKRYKRNREEYSERELNEFGEQGWELCGCYPEYSCCSNMMVGVNYIFKRPKQQP